MMRARLAVLAVLLAAAPTARAQTDPSTGVPNALSGPVKAYRAGNLQSAEAQLRVLAPASPDAEAWLGAVLLDLGKNSEALKSLQHAADAGSSEGQHQLALVFAEGRAGTPRNDQRAAQLFEQAANSGHPRAQLDLGILYLRGQGVARDLVQARAWLEKAAAHEAPYALYALGRAMEESEGPALADPVRAADLYRRSAEMGHPLAALRYGLALLDGQGVRKDRVAAQRWLVQANQDGVPEAALALADMIVRMPANRDKAENQKLVQQAVTWYQSAAEAGVPSAQFKLANACFAGRGVPRDPGLAQSWYDRAARQGLPEAQHALGLLLIGGVAGPKDPAEGYKWLLLAERGGVADSHAVREKASEQISPADRSRGEALAHGFKPVAERPTVEGLPRLIPPARP
jgi:TPR repeat protein